MHIDLEDLPNVPPAIGLLLSEAEDCASWADFRKRIKGMLRDLRDQSEAYLVKKISPSKENRNPLLFDVHLDGGLDLLTKWGACAELGCRIDAADRIARSFGLIADRLWVTDMLSEQFLDFGRATNDKLDGIVAEVLVLQRLAPLIAAGVVHFRSNWMPTCQSCASAFRDEIERITIDLTKTFKSDIRLKKSRGKDWDYVADTGKCFEPPIVIRGFSGEDGNIPRRTEFIERFISRDVRATLWNGRAAAVTGGSIVSNSRLGLASLLHQEGRLSNRHDLTILEDERHVSVPWVSELNAMQIVQLREEASAALPSFRLQMAKALSHSTNDALPQKASFVIDALREQAAEVRGELDARKKHAARYWKKAYGLLGLGLCAYGIASDQVLPGAAGLLS